MNQTGITQCYFTQNHLLTVQNIFRFDDRAMLKKMVHYAKDNAQRIIRLKSRIEDNQDLALDLVDRWKEVGQSIDELIARIEAIEAQYDDKPVVMDFDRFIWSTVGLFAVVGTFVVIFVAIPFTIQCCLTVFN